MYLLISVDTQDTNANMFDQHLQIFVLYLFFRADLFEHHGNVVEYFIQRVIVLSTAGKFVMGGKVALKKSLQKGSDIAIKAIGIPYQLNYRNEYSHSDVY